MRKYRIIAIAALAVSAAAAWNLPVYAADSTPTTPPAATAPKHRGNALQQLLEPLNLTQDQKDKLKPIMKDASAKVKAIRQDTTITDKKEKAQKVRDLWKDTLENQVKPILTDDQKKQLEAEQAKAAATRRHRRNKGGAAAGTATTQ